MLADIGGSLGLFIGASVLSIGEIIEALYMYLHVLCSRRKERLETIAQWTATVTQDIQLACVTIFTRPFLLRVFSMLPVTFWKDCLSAEMVSVLVSNIDDRRGITAMTISLGMIIMCYSGTDCVHPDFCSDGVVLSVLV